MAVELPRVEEGGDDQLRLLASFICIALELVAVVADIALASRSVFVLYVQEPKTSMASSAMKMLVCVHSRFGDARCTGVLGMQTCCVCSSSEKSFAPQPCRTAPRQSKSCAHTLQPRSSALSIPLMPPQRFTEMVW